MENNFFSKNSAKLSEISSQFTGSLFNVILSGISDSPIFLAILTACQSDLLFPGKMSLWTFNWSSNRNPTLPPSCTFCKIHIHCSDLPYLPSNCLHRSNSLKKLKVQFTENVLQLKQARSIYTGDWMVKIDMQILTEKCSWNNFSLCFLILPISVTYS